MILNTVCDVICVSVKRPTILGRHVKIFLISLIVSLQTNLLEPHLPLLENNPNGGYRIYLSFGPHISFPKLFNAFGRNFCKI